MSQGEFGIIIINLLVIVVVAGITCLLLALRLFHYKDKDHDEWEKRLDKNEKINQQILDELKEMRKG